MGVGEFLCNPYGRCMSMKIKKSELGTCSFKESICVHVHSFMSVIQLYNIEL